MKNSVRLPPMKASSGRGAIRIDVLVEFLSIFARTTVFSNCRVIFNVSTPVFFSPRPKDLDTEPTNLRLRRVERRVGLCGGLGVCVVGVGGGVGGGGCCSNRDLTQQPCRSRVHPAWHLQKCD